MKAPLVPYLSLLVFWSCAPLEPQNQKSAASAAGLADKKFSDGEFSCYEVKAALALAGEVPITYSANIKAVVDTQCVACHSGKATGTSPDLSTFAALRDEGEASLRRIKAGTMPPAGALAAAQQELFAQWVEGGMLENPTTPSSSDATAATTLKALCKTAASVPEAVATGTGSDTASASGSGSGSASGSDAGSGSAVASGSGSGSASGSGSGAASGSDTAPAKTTYLVDLKPLIDAKCANCHRVGGQPPDLSSFATAKAGGVRSLVRVSNGTMPTVGAGGALSATEMALYKAWSDDGFLEKE